MGARTCALGSAQWSLGRCSASRTTAGPGPGPGAAGTRRGRGRAVSQWWPRQPPPPSPIFPRGSECLNVPPSYGGVSTCGPCVDGPHFASLFICPRILGSLSCHLEILNLVTSARSLQHCEAIGSQVLGIRAWTLLGAKSSLPPCPVTPLACTSWAHSLWGWVSFLSSGGHYGSAVVTFC